MIIRPHVARFALHAALAAGVALALAACATSAQHPPLRLAPSVDIPRYMGDWYVIGVIPTFLEKDAWNAVEHYDLAADGAINITYSYNKDGSDGERKTLRSKGFVRGGNGAIWGVQFIWPFEADYRIVHISEAYDAVVVGREKRDNVWIMSRRPSMADADYQRLVALVASQGYDTSKLVRVPQRR
jgi:apolipoprotein D and lipocalin family protein